jgi:hypothetical protein
MNALIVIEEEISLCGAKAQAYRPVHGIVGNVCALNFRFGYRGEMACRVIGVAAQSGIQGRAGETFLPKSLEVELVTLPFNRVPMRRTGTRLKGCSSQIYFFLRLAIKLLGRRLNPLIRETRTAAR